MTVFRRKLVGLMAVALVVAACSGGTNATTAPTDGGTSAAPPAAELPGASAGASASAAASECGVTVNANGGLDPLPDGFPNQPITLISIDDPGAPDGIYALTLKSVIEEAGLTDQRITVVDRPDFGTYGTWEGLDFINQDPAGKEGYVLAIATIPGATVDLLATDVVEALGAEIEKLNIIQSTEYVPYVMTSRKDAPWGNDVDAMIKAAQAAPGTLKYISRGPGSGLDLAFSNYRQIAGQRDGTEGGDGIPVQEIIGGSHAEINAVLGAGEGDIAMTLSDVAKQFYDDGRVEVLTLSGNAPTPEPWTVPTMKDYFGPELLASDPWGQNRTLFGATDMDECHHEWLVKLVDLGYGHGRVEGAALGDPGPDPAEPEPRGDVRAVEHGRGGSLPDPQEPGPARPGRRGTEPLLIR